MSCMRSVKSSLTSGLAVISSSTEMLLFQCQSDWHRTISIMATTFLWMFLTPKVPTMENIGASKRYLHYSTTSKLHFPTPSLVVQLEEKNFWGDQPFSLFNYPWWTCEITIQISVFPWSLANKIRSKRHSPLPTTQFLQSSRGSWRVASRARELRCRRVLRGSSSMPPWKKPKTYFSRNITFTLTLKPAGTTLLVRIIVYQHISASTLISSLQLFTSMPRSRRRRNVEICKAVASKQSPSRTSCPPPMLDQYYHQSFPVLWIAPYIPHPTVFEHCITSKMAPTICKYSAPHFMKILGSHD